MRKLPALVVLLATVTLFGCVSAPSPQYQSGVGNTGILLNGKSAQMRTGDFNAASGIENQSLSVRGSTITGSSKDGTFSTYLQEALQTELVTAGLFDPSSPVVVSGTLVDNHLNGAGASTGNATISARFVVMRNGNPAYDRVLKADHTWKSFFMGAVAIPAAFQNYATTVQKLLGQLFDDPDFKRATAK